MGVKMRIAPDNSVRIHVAPDNAVRMRVEAGRLVVVPAATGEKPKKEAKKP